MAEEQKPRIIEYLHPEEVEHETNYLDLLLVLAKNKTMIIGAMAAAFVLSCIYSLNLPDIYTATSRILPQQQEKGGLAAMMTSGIGDFAALTGFPGRGGLGEMYVGMLESRTVADAIIDRFGLMEKFKWKTRSGAYAALSHKIKVSADRKSGFLTIEVDDKDPQFAADLANAYVDELKKMNVMFNLTNAGRERVFLEERLEVVRTDLIQAENSLRDFQQAKKAIKIDAQASAVIEGIAKLKAELAGKEVELGVLLTSQTEQNPQVRAMREGIGQLRNQLRKLEESSTEKKVSEDIFIAMADVPDVGLQYARLLRDYKVQETLFELLSKQYEVAKINEAKNTSSLQVLDEAVVPDRKSKPKRRKKVILATMVAGFLSVVLAFIREKGKRMDEKDRQRWDEIRGQLRLWKILKKRELNEKP